MAEPQRRHHAPHVRVYSRGSEVVLTFHSAEKPLRPEHAMRLARRLIECSVEAQVNQALDLAERYGQP